MTHTGPMEDEQGVFGQPQQSEFPCRHCKGGPVFYSVWESNCGGYEDFKYRCSKCGSVWWVEGPDA